MDHNGDSRVELEQMRAALRLKFVLARDHFAESVNQWIVIRDRFLADHGPDIQPKEAFNSQAA